MEGIFFGRSFPFFESAVHLSIFGGEEGSGSGFGVCRNLAHLGFL